MARKNKNPTLRMWGTTQNQLRTRTSLGGLCEEVATSWSKKRECSSAHTVHDHLPSSLVAPGGGIGSISGVGVAEVLLATLLALLRLASLLGSTLLELVAAELLVATKLLLVSTEVAATVAAVATLLAALLAVIVVATLLLHAIHSAAVASVRRAAAVCKFQI